MNRSEFFDTLTLAHWILRKLAKGQDLKIKLPEADHPQGVNYLGSFQEIPEKRLSKLRLRKRNTIINSSSSDDSDVDSTPEFKADALIKPSTRATKVTRQGLKRSKPDNSISSDNDTDNKSGDSSRFLALKKYHLVLSDTDDDDNKNSRSTTAPSGDSGTHDV